LRVQDADSFILGNFVAVLDEAGQAFLQDAALVARQEPHDRFRFLLVVVRERREK
jgi:hypothetical protein